MVGGLIAANSSTILTHLNWGASYLVHDFYKRFLRPGQTEHHYVWAGRMATIGLFLGAAGMMYLMTSAKDSFDLILQVGAGTGLLYILRWFWWRITAWCEVVAMLSSFGISAYFLVVAKFYERAYSSHLKLIYTVLFTTLCWVVMALVGPQTDHQKLLEFYKKVKPFGPGWRKFRQAEHVAASEVATGESLPLALLGWFCGCATIWSALFTIGNLLYGRIAYTLVCGAVFVLAGGVLIRVVSRLWQSSRSS
jgi:SSS family solute:Na+ symporter